MQSSYQNCFGTMSNTQSKFIGECTVSMSKLALGTVQIGYDPEISFEQAKEIIYSAYLQGVRYFDSAPMYGFGRAEYTLSTILHELKIRNKVLVSTKVGRVLNSQGNYSKNPIWYLNHSGYQYDYTYDGIMSSFEDSLNRTGLDHIDLLLVHDLGNKWHGDKAHQYWKQFCESGFKALDELRKNRDVFAIGMGVNETEVVLNVAKQFEIDCALIAGQYTLLDHEYSYKNLEKLSELNIAVFAAGIFNSGILASGNSEQARYNYGKVPTEILLKVHEIESICLKYNVSLSTAALQFTASHPAISSLVFGAKSENEVMQNISSFTRHVPYEFWNELKCKNLISSNVPVPVSDQ